MSSRRLKRQIYISEAVVMMLGRSRPRSDQDGDALEDFGHLSHVVDCAESDNFARLEERLESVRGGVVVVSVANPQCRRFRRRIQSLCGATRGGGCASGTGPHAEKETGFLWLPVAPFQYRGVAAQSGPGTRCASLRRFSGCFGLTAQAVGDKLGWGATLGSGSRNKMSLPSRRGECRRAVPCRASA